MFGSLLTTFLIILVTLFLHKFVIKTYLSILSFRKQGFKGHYFFPLFGFAKLNRYYLEKHNDFNLCRKRILTDFPGTRGFVSNIFDRPLIILTDAGLKKDFYINKQHLYKKTNLVSDFFKVEGEDFSKSLLFSEGEDWKRTRRLASKIFNFEFMNSNIPVISKTADSVFDNVKTLENVNLMDEFQTITGNVLLKSLLGEEFVERTYNGVPAPIAIANITAAVTSKRAGILNAILGIRGIRLFDSEFRRNSETQKDFQKVFMGEYIREKYMQYQSKVKGDKGYQPINFLETTFVIVDKGEENFSLEDVASLVSILFLAGTDTTGHQVAHAVYLLSKNPGMLEKLVKEVDHVNADLKNAGDYEEIKNLPYLNAVLKETLRIASPAADIFTREAMQDHTLGNIQIKKGTYLQAGISANFFDPAIFKNPFEFVPERWIKGHELCDNAEEKDPYAFVPFSAGPRNCIGQHLANIEARIILTKFLKRFSYQLKMKEKEIWGFRFLLELKEPIIGDLKVRS